MSVRQNSPSIQKRLIVTSHSQADLLKKFQFSDRTPGSIFIEIFSEGKLSKVIIQIQTVPIQWKSKCVKKYWSLQFGIIRISCMPRVDLQEYLFKILLHTNPQKACRPHMWLQMETFPTGMQEFSKTRATHLFRRFQSMPMEIGRFKIRNLSKRLLDI